VLIVEKIQAAQDSYYNKRTLSKRKYERLAGEYKLRRIEVEKAIAVLQAKLATKETRELLKESEEKVERLEQKHLEKIRKEPADTRSIKSIWKSPLKIIPKTESPGQSEAAKPVTKEQLPSASSAEAKPLTERKVILAKLKTRFGIDKIKPKNRIKEIKALQDYGFQVKPKVSNMILDSRLHSKERIIKKLREVYHD